VNDRRALAAIVAAVALVYASAPGGVFQFDDHAVIVENPLVHSWGAWFASMPGIRPLLKASYALCWSLAPAAWIFVLFNVVCHAVNGCLVYVLVRQWAGEFGPARAQPAHLALAAALIFVLHPAQTEAVTYIAGRSVSLMALFYLGALVAQQRGRAGVSLVLFGLALAVRETAWTLPGALFLIELARGRSVRDAWVAARAHVALLVAVAACAASLPVYRAMLARSFDVRGPFANLAAQVDGIAYLVTRPLLALRLSIDPDIATGAFGVRWLAAAAALLAMAAAGVFWLRRRPLAGFALLWFLLQLAPTNSLIARLDLANDRQLYLALVGPALLAAAGLMAIPSARGAGIATTALCVLLGGATVLRNRDYASEVALWEASIRASPGKARAWNNLGYAWQLAGDADRAAAAYARALALDPGEYKARVNLELLRGR
jgi:tetratricopeptide (TPR) repeat protein